MEDKTEWARLLAPAGCWPCWLGSLQSCPQEPRPKLINYTSPLWPPDFGLLCN